MTDQATVERAKRAAVALARAVYETVLEGGPEGAPASSLYLACQSYGISLATFEGIMTTLVNAGMVRKRGHCYYPPHD